MGLGHFLGGMAQGYGTVMQFHRQANDDKWREEERERRRREREEEDETKRLLRKEAEPARVTQTDVAPTVANDDEGNAMPRVAAQAVNGVTYADASQAAQARTQYDAMPAVVARQAGVFARRSKPVDALSLNNAVQSYEKSALDLEQAREQRVRVRFQRAVGDALAKDGPQGFADLMTKNYGDGNTYSASDVNRHGGFTLNARDQQGNVRQRVFDTDADAFGFAMVFGEPAKFIERADRRASEARADKHREATLAEQGRHNLASERLAQQSADSLSEYRKGEIAYRNEALKATRGDGMPQFDDAAAQKIVAGALDDDNKARLAAGKPPMTHAERADYMQQGVGAMRAQWASQQKLGAAANSLRAAGDEDGADYAMAWDRATKAGIPPADLQRVGFKPGRPVARSGQQREAMLHTAIQADAKQTGAADYNVQLRGQPMRQVRSAPSGSPAQAAQGGIPMIERVSDATLKRIAAIQGHTSQAAAIAELERRRAAADERANEPQLFPQ